MSESSQPPPPSTAASAPPPARPSGLEAFFGWTFAISAALLLLICGGCTAVFFVMSIAQDGGMALLALAIGAPGIAIGVGLGFAARSLLRRR